WRYKPSHYQHSYRYWHFPHYGHHWNHWRYRWWGWNRYYRGFGTPAVGMAGPSGAPQADAAPTSAPSAAPARMAAPGNCLTKSYMPDGTAVCQDVCTKEVGMGQPQESGPAPKQHYPPAAPRANPGPAGALFFVYC